MQKIRNTERSNVRFSAPTGQQIRTKSTRAGGRDCEPTRNTEKRPTALSRALLRTLRDDYDALLALQGGVCAICSKNRPLGVDHCHLFNEVRGLLCDKCNLGLGMFDDDPDRLRAAADYLERSRRAPLSMRRQSTGTPGTGSTGPTERRSVTSPRKPAQPGRPSAASGRSSNGTPRTTPLGRRKTK